ncbi:hypothetical protein QBC43DRAFT_316100 [Cladorrhinum sp. PSN259]|nr:hypothetical protein QBC43DRAFT_316100 [Cladorrhinum sp. PSN259]
MSKKPNLPRRISHSTPPSTTSRRHVEDDYPSRGRRRHSVMGGRHHSRGRSTDSDDTYYDPRDKYYLTGSEDEGPARSSRRGRARSLNPLRRKDGHRSRSASTAPSTRSPSPESDHYSRSRRRRSHHSPSPSPSSRSSSPPPRSPRHSHSKYHHSRQHHRSNTSPSPPPYSPKSSSRGRSTHHHHRVDSRSRSPSTSPPPYSPRSFISSKSRGRSRSLNPFSRHRSPSESRSPSPPPQEKRNAPPKTPTEIFMTASKIAFETAALTALKLRDDPSPLLGPKGGKIAAAALSAAFVDTFIDKKHPKVRKGGLRHTVMRQATQLAIGNIVGNGMKADKHEDRKGGITGKITRGHHGRGHGKGRRR